MESTKSTSKKSQNPTGSPEKDRHSERSLADEDLRIELPEWLLRNNRKELLQALLNTIPIWTNIATVEEGRYIAANQAFYDNTGYRETDVIGKTSIEFGLWPDPKERPKVIRILKENKCLSSFPIRFRMSNGEMREFHWWAQLVEFNGKLCKVNSIIDVSHEQYSQEALIDREYELLVQSKRPKKLDSALDVLIERRDEERKDIYSSIGARLEKEVFPFIENMKTGQIDPESRLNLSIIEASLHKLVSSFSDIYTLKQAELTPTERKVVELIRRGLQSKEIAEMLKVSLATVSFHRFNIRKKFGLLNRKINLNSYLQSNGQ